MVDFLESRVFGLLVKSGLWPAYQILVLKDPYYCFSDVATIMAIQKVVLCLNQLTLENR